MEKTNKLETKNTIGRLIINGKDISECIYAYEIKQRAGELPEVIVKARPRNIDMIINELKEVVVIKEETK